MLGPGQYVIGRASGCEIKIEDSRISRRHASLHVAPDRIEIEDLDSCNGLFVNGVRTGRAQLSSGDRINLGPVELRLTETPRSEGPYAADNAFSGQHGMESEILERGRLEVEPPLDSQRLQILYSILESLASKLRLEEVMPDILKILDRMFTYDRCSIAARDRDGRLVTLASRPSEGGVPYSRTIAKRILERGEALLYDDIQSEAPFALGESVIGLNIRSVICSPLVFMGRIRGLVYLDRSRAGVYDGDDLALLRSICHVIAIVLENVRLYADLEARYQAKADRLRIVQRRLIETERAAALGRLARSIAHEIRNPVMAIVGRIKYLVRRTRDPFLEENILPILAEAGRLERMMSRVDAMVNLPGPRFGLYSLTSTVEKALDKTKEAMENRHIHARLHSVMGSAAIPHDPDLTGIAVTAVLQNACATVPENGCLHVHVFEAEEGWAVEVSENRSRSEETELKGIFDPFFLSHPWAVDLGLTLAQQAMAGQGGGILVGRNDGAGTTVRLVLPERPPEIDA